MAGCPGADAGADQANEPKGDTGGRELGLEGQRA